MEDLIKRLRNCTSDTVEDCAGCPYQGGYKGTYCMNGLIEEAADAIEELTQKEKFHSFLWNVIQPNEMELYISMYRAQAVHQEPPKEET